MTLKISSRGQIPPFMAMDVMRDAAALERGGKSIIHLEVGQPSTGIPRGTLARIEKALQVDTLGYTLAEGMAPLRDRLAKHYRDTYGAKVPTERIYVTTGSSGGFILAFVAAFDAGDRVALASPGYPAYRHILTSLGVMVELIPVDAATRFQVTLDHLKKMSPLPTGLIVASPANPTGSMMPPDEFKALALFCAENGVRLISDEIYHGITYGMKPTTAAGLVDSAIVVNSFSKYFSMTGWRVGWLVIPDELRRPMECLAQNLFIAPPAVSQHAALAVFNYRDELDANVARYANNRDVLLKRLPEIGFSRLAPADGAFYIYADVRALTDDAQDYCRRMLNEAGVAATPGLDFDPIDGRHFIRFSFAGATADMEEACNRLAKWGARNSK